MRILFSTFGSAGDLFPLMPVAEDLVASGHEVRVAGGRGVGLYIRSHPTVRAVALGTGAELGALDDRRALNREDGGWASWGHILDHYVVPALPGDLQALELSLERWRPDLMVTTTFAVAARLVAARHGIPVRTVSIYPQMAHVVDATPPQAVPFTDVVARWEGGLAGPRVCWGEPADVLLHDRNLLAGAHPELVPVGFPSWEPDVPVTDEEAALSRWLARTAGPCVLFTLGSFIGMVEPAFWRTALDALRSIGGRGVLVGARDRFVADLADARTDVFATGFLPLTRNLGPVDAVVHHGGIGTTFAVLRAGRPAVVVPQAFDQMLNGRLITSAGAGTVAGPTDLATELSRALEPAASASASVLATQLVPSEVAAKRASSALLAGAG